MKKIPTEQDIDWQLTLPDQLDIPVDRQDLSEVLGNIFDNARKWTRSTIRIAIVTSPSEVHLLTEDDGTGGATEHGRSDREAAGRDLLGANGQLVARIERGSGRDPVHRAERAN